jgi:ribosome-binding protein aMBF1 (putative translation factor)
MPDDKACSVCGRKKNLKIIKVLGDDVDVCESSKSCQSFVATQNKARELEKKAEQKIKKLKTPDVFSIGDRVVYKGSKDDWRDKTGTIIALFSNADVRVDMDNGMGPNWWYRINARHIDE